MQTFRVNTGEAQKLTWQLSQVVDDAWKMLVDRETHNVSDSYDLSGTVNRLNLYRTLRALDGADYRTVHGQDCPLDMVKITNWSPDTCGCTVSMTWRRDLPETDRVHHAHRSHVKCSNHEHLATHDDHHAEVLAENQHKNQSIGALAAHLDVPVSEIQWSHADDHTLVLEHPKLDGNSSALAHLAAHPQASKRPVRLIF